MPDTDPRLWTDATATEGLSCFLHCRVKQKAGPFTGQVYMLLGLSPGPRNYGQ